jgi:hypothetical protein
LEVIADNRYRAILRRFCGGVARLDNQEFIEGTFAIANIHKDE